MEKTLCEINETSKTKAIIDVMLDHVECEVVESAETPDADQQQKRHLPGKRQADEKDRREQAEEQKEKPFGDD